MSNSERTAAFAAMVRENPEWEHHFRAAPRDVQRRIRRGAARLQQEDQRLALGVATCMWFQHGESDFDAALDATREMLFANWDRYLRMTPQQQRNVNTVVEWSIAIRGVQQFERDDPQRLMLIGATADRFYEDREGFNTMLRQAFAYNVQRSRQSTGSETSGSGVDVDRMSEVEAEQFVNTWTGRFRQLNVTEQGLVRQVAEELQGTSVDDVRIATATMCFFNNTGRFNDYLRRAFARHPERATVLYTHHAAPAAATAEEMLPQEQPQEQPEDGSGAAGTQSVHGSSASALRALPTTAQPPEHYLQLYEEADAATQAVISESAAWVAAQVAPEDALAAASFLYFDRNVVHTAPSAAAAQPEDRAAAEPASAAVKEPEHEPLGLVEYSATDSGEQPYSEPLQCLLPGCERVPVQLRCCNKLLCEGCMLGCSKISGQRNGHDRRFVLACPFCRTQSRVNGRKLLAQECPSHAKVMGTIDGGQAVVAHLPDPSGSYGAASRLIFFDL